ncbi:MAG TPA: DUF6496 domain-containing protein [Candidatus Polarisedimenticolaceae bacterium]|nr:DUF6496 domain-containing protein [Candidatus Polarisedimenticolaceae bacterium]
MPEKETLRRARKDKRQGKAATTQAGEFVREEIHHVREGKHGARNAKQAIAIGLNKARRSGVDVPPPEGGSEQTRERAGKKPSARRSRATRGALKREGSRSASRKALSRQATSSSRRRGATSRKAAAKKAARTRERNRSGR